MSCVTSEANANEPNMEASPTLVHGGSDPAEKVKDSLPVRAKSSFYVSNHSWRHMWVMIPGELPRDDKTEAKTEPSAKRRRTMPSLPRIHLARIHGLELRKERSVAHVHWTTTDMGLSAPGKKWTKPVSIRNIVRLNTFRLPLPQLEIPTQEWSEPDKALAEAALAEYHRLCEIIDRKHPEAPNIRHPETKSTVTVNGVPISVWARVANFLDQPHVLRIVCSGFAGVGMASATNELLLSTSRDYPTEVAWRFNSLALGTSSIRNPSCSFVPWDRARAEQALVWFACQQNLGNEAAYGFYITYLPTNAEVEAHVQHGAAIYGKQPPNLLGLSYCAWMGHDRPGHLGRFGVASSRQVTLSSGMRRGVRFLQMTSRPVPGNEAQQWVHIRTILDTADVEMIDFLQRHLVPIHLKNRFSCC